MHLACRDIPGLRRQILGQLLLDREVPAQDIAALEAIASGGERILRRNVDDAVAERRSDDLRYTFGQRTSGERVRVWRVAVQYQQDRVIRPQGSRNIPRIPIQAETCADHPRAARAISDPQTR